MENGPALGHSNSIRSGPQSYSNDLMLIVAISMVG